MIFTAFDNSRFLHNTGIVENGCPIRPTGKVSVPGGSRTAHHFSPRSRTEDGFVSRDVPARMYDVHIWEGEIPSEPWVSHGFIHIVSIDGETHFGRPFGDQDDPTYTDQMRALARKALFAWAWKSKGGNEMVTGSTVAVAETISEMTTDPDEARETALKWYLTEEEAEYVKEYVFWLQSQGD